MAQLRPNFDVETLEGRADGAIRTILTTFGEDGIPPYDKEVRKEGKRKML